MTKYIDFAGSLNWQHSLCSNPRQNPDIRTLFVDHNCRNPNESFAQLNSSSQMMNSVPKADGFLPMGANGVYI